MASSNGPAELVRRLQAAVLEHDAATLDELVASDFGLTGSPALGLLNKQEWIAAALEFSWDSFEFEEMQTVELGHTTAVISHVRQRGTWNGRDIGATFLLIDVWREATAGWQLVSRYAERSGD